jgi:hypothetical protein
VFGSYAEGAPGPDGFPFLFYQKLWDLIKQDIFNIFIDWQARDLDLFRLNFSLLTLIPKEPDAITIQKYRPIALTNCSFKIFLNVLLIDWGRLVTVLLLLTRQPLLEADSFWNLLCLSMR